MDCCLQRRAWSFGLKAILGAGLAASAIGLSSTRSSAADAAAVAPANDVKTLVAQLGDESFSIRESATNQLIRQGAAAKAEMLVAVKDPDAEVRSRARQVLERIVAAERKRQLQAFRNDIDGNEGVTLPGWAVFKKTVGDDPVARELFVKMQEAEPDLMEALEQGPKQAAEVLEQRTRVATANLKREQAGLPSARGATPAMGSILAMLFVGGDPAVRLGDEAADLIIALPRSPEFRSAIAPSASPQREPCQRLLGRWVARELPDKYLTENLAFAVGYDLKEGIEPARRTLKQQAAVGPQAPQPAMARAGRTLQQQSSFGKFWSLVLIARFGGKDDLELIKPFLGDAQVYLDGASNNQPMQAQIRDAALAATVQLSGQNPKEFGFERFQATDRVQLNAVMIAFHSEKERVAAFEKWQAWQNGKKQAAREKAEPKTSIE
jgi:hypothetical protein